MTSSTSYVVTPERADLITEIVCTLLRARLVFGKACNLVTVPTNPDNYDGCEEKFLFTDRILYRILLHHIEKIPKSKEYRVALKVLRDNRDQSMIRVSRTLSCGTEAYDPCVFGIKHARYDYTGEENHDLFLLVNPQERLLANTISPWNSIYDVLDSLNKKQWWREDMTGEPLSGWNAMAPLQTMFRIFTTDTVTSVGNIDIPKKWNKESENLLAKDHQPDASPATIVAREYLLGIRNLLVSKDTSQLPDAFIDQGIIKQIVNIETSTQRRSSKTEYVNYISLVGSSLEVKMASDTFSSSLKSMEREVDALFARRFEPNGGLHFPELAFVLSVDATTDWKRLGIFELGADDICGCNISVPGGTNRPAESNISLWNVLTRPKTLQSTNSVITKNGLLSTVLSISELLRYLDTDELRTVSKNADALANRVNQLYRFLGAVRALCAPELLAESI